jgi:hypothetical protein
MHSGALLLVQRNPRVILPDLIVCLVGLFVTWVVH